MTTQLRWHVGIGSAWLAAAEHELAFQAEAGTVPSDPIIGGDATGDDDAQGPFRREVEALAAALEGHLIAAPTFLAQLAALAPAIDSRRELAHTALTKLRGRERADALAPPGTGTGLVGLLAACEREFTAAHPQVLEELRLRTGPLRELWEARGPGLLAGVARRTERSCVVESATVALTPPLAGGGGTAYPTTNVVRFEAVLANPIGALPEIARLAWLVSQLAADQVEHPLRSGTAQEVVAAAMLPAVLEAAGELEVVAADDASLFELAAREWKIKLLADRRRLELLQTWWTMTTGHGAYAGRPWSFRLAALDKLFVDGMGAE